MNKKIIVTGATGQVGSYMCEYLLNETSHEVIGAVRRTSQLIYSNLSDCLGRKKFKTIDLDLVDTHSINNAIINEKPDYFINLGAATFVADSWNTPVNHFQVNACGVLHILEAIRTHQPNCRFYSSGTSEMWGDVKYSPQDEKHPFSPRSPYGASKCAAHYLTKVYRESYNLYAIQGIMLNNESERRQEYFVTRKITKKVAEIKNKIDRGQLFKPLEFDPLQVGNLNSLRDWSHSLDFVDGIWRMLNEDFYMEDINYHIYDAWLDGNYGEKERKFLCSKIKEYVLSSGKSHSIREFIEKCFNYVGIKGEWMGEGLDEIYNLIEINGNRVDYKKDLVVVNPKFFRPAEVNTLCGDSSLIKKELDWQPQISFDELINRMMANDLKQYA